MKWSRFNHFFDTDKDGDRYAFNARTLALAKLDSASYDTIKQLEQVSFRSSVATTDGLDVATIQHLQDGKFLVADDLDELVELETVFSHRKHNNHNLTLTIAPTIWCNLACPYCYEGEKLRGMMDEATQEKTFAFVQHQVETNGIDAVSVAWYGGEPLLGLDVIEKLSVRLIEYCDGSNIPYHASIVTNGVLLTKGVAERLRACRVSQVQVTIDGPREVHDKMRPFYGTRKGSTFDIIMSNLADVIGLIPIRLRVNIDKRNATRAIDLVMDFKQRDWLRSSADFAFYFARIHDAEFLKQSPGCNDSAGSCYDSEQFAALELELHGELLRRGVSIRRYPSLKLSSCGTVAAHGYVIGPKGELYKCWEDAGVADRVIGNVADLSVNTDAPKVAKWLQWSPFQDEVCKSCSVLPTCMGGCPAHALLHGRSSGVNCTSWKHALQGNIQHYLRDLFLRQAGQSQQSGVSA